MSQRIPGKYDHLKKQATSTGGGKKLNSSTSRLLKIFVISLVLFGGLLYSGILQSPDNTTNYSEDTPEIWNAESEVVVDMVIFSDAGCSCCHEYNDYVQEWGYTTEMQYPEKMADIKNYLQIPDDHRSCHTMRIGDYFVEGHVPIEAVQELLATSPAIDGIALANMPAGSPGMGGEKAAAFDIYQVIDGEATGIFMTI